MEPGLDCSSRRGLTIYLAFTPAVYLLRAGKEGEGLLGVEVSGGGEGGKGALWRQLLSPSSAVLRV